MISRQEFEGIQHISELLDLADEYGIYQIYDNIYTDVSLSDYMDNEIPEYLMRNSWLDLSKVLCEIPDCAYYIYNGYMDFRRFDEHYDFDIYKDVAREYLELNELFEKEPNEDEEEILEQCSDAELQCFLFADDYNAAIEYTSTMQIN